MKTLAPLLLSAVLLLPETGLAGKSQVLDSESYEKMLAATWMYAGAAKSCGYTSYFSTLRHNYDSLKAIGKKRGLDTPITKMWDVMGVDNMIGALAKEQTVSPKMTCSEVESYCRKLIDATAAFK